MPKARPLTHSKNYTEFTASRDRALEKILHVYLSATDLVLEKLRDKTLAHLHLSPRTVDQEFRLAATQVAVLMHRMRTEAYLLAHRGEAQAMALALGKPHRVKPKGPKPETPSGGSVEDRVALYFSRLKHKVDDAIRLAKVMGDTTEATRTRVARAFPPMQRLRPKATPALSRRRLTEADVGRGMNSGALTTGFYDEDTWDDVLTDYFAKDLPDNIFARGPDDRVLFFDLDAGKGPEARYSWEVEQEITEDFVHQVRAGTNDAANENGVSDFLWNAVIDSHTDECCSLRDGHTSKEIGDMIQDGDLDADVCDAIVAPAHFNCRCKSVPMSDNLPDVEPDFQGFDDWLQDKSDAA